MHVCVFSRRHLAQKEREGLREGVVGEWEEEEQEEEVVVVDAGTIGCLR